MNRPSERQLRAAETATWGPHPTAEEGRPRMRLLDWRPLVKGALRGFATVELPIGLKIHDVPILIGRNGAWASLPAKPQIDKDGRQKVGADGKPAYAAVLEWRDRDAANRFSEAIISLVRARHPGALDEPSS